MLAHYSVLKCEVVTGRAERAILYDAGNCLCRLAHVCQGHDGK